MIYATEQQVVVTAGLVVAVGLIALFLGIWYGRGRGFAEAEEEQRWEREQAKARRTHPVYHEDPRITHRQPRPYELSYEERLAHEDQAEQALAVTFGQLPPDVPDGQAITTGEDQALTIANEVILYDPLLPSGKFSSGDVFNGQAVTTGEIQAITDETDVMVARWEAETGVWLAERGLA